MGRKKLEKRRHYIKSMVSKETIDSLNAFSSALGLCVGEVVDMMVAREYLNWKDSLKAIGALNNSSKDR